MLKSKTRDSPWYFYASSRHDYYHYLIFLDQNMIFKKNGIKQLNTWIFFSSIVILLSRLIIGWISFLCTSRRWSYWSKLDVPCAQNSHQNIIKILIPANSINVNQKIERKPCIVFYGTLLTSKKNRLLEFWIKIRYCETGWSRGVYIPIQSNFIPPPL